MDALNYNGVLRAIFFRFIRNIVQVVMLSSIFMSIWCLSVGFVSLYMHTEDFRKMYMNKNIPDFKNLYKGLSIKGGGVTYYVPLFLFSVVNFVVGINIIYTLLF